MGMCQPKQELAMSTETILMRLQECIIPDDKETILDYLEMLDEKCERKSTAAEFKEGRGVLSAMKIMKKMIDDPVVVRLGLAIINTSLTYQPIIMDFIQYGGIDFLKKVEKEHEKDEFLGGFIPPLLKQVLAIGATAAMTEINDEITALQMCKACQEVVVRQRYKGVLGLVEVKVPKASDRAGRVIMFMENYRTRKDVQLLAVDALIMYAKNGDCLSTIDDTDTLENIAEAIKTFITEVNIMWRACVALTLIAKMSPELCNQTAQLEVHDLMADNFDVYAPEPRLQQQVLWVFNSLLTYPIGRREIHGSEKCLALFKRLLEKREVETANLKHLPKADQLKPFQVVIPHQIRAFMRETKGLLRGTVAVDKKAEENIAKKVKERKNFDPKPRYGTVDEEFKQGEPGLATEDDVFTGKKGLELAAAKNAALKADSATTGDWGLTYGKKGGMKIFNSVVAPSDKA